jgi:hypothetical protein
MKKNVTNKSLNLKKDGSENRIDSIIREYLYERRLYMENNQKKTFSKKSSETLEEIMSNLSDIVEDLEVIKEKEGDILLYNNKYTDEILENYIQDLKNKSKKLQEMINFTKNNKNSDNLDIIY